jgi:hypothetical protein
MATVFRMRRLWTTGVNAKTHRMLVNGRYGLRLESEWADPAL